MPGIPFPGFFVVGGLQCFQVPQFDVLGNQQMRGAAHAPNLQFRNYF